MNWEDVMYFLHLFHAGGFMMYPLLLCSIIVV
ncbi:MAG: MotA/TolQ/ExbB proton channel family protein, partial [Dialister invisus]|nr:MotA/TolQ/ExbB proton channel family protein [Dialister invisus]